MSNVSFRPECLLLPLAMDPDLDLGLGLGLVPLIGTLLPEIEKRLADTARRGLRLMVFVAFLK